MKRWSTEELRIMRGALGAAEDEIEQDTIAHDRLTLAGFQRRLSEVTVKMHTIRNGKECKLERVDLPPISTKTTAQEVIDEGMAARLTPESIQGRLVNAGYFDGEVKEAMRLHNREQILREARAQEGVTP